jgi:hypothetical protein
LCYAQINGQAVQISGTITDRAKSPVDFALVYVEGRNIYSHSNSNGEFVLNIPLSDDTSSRLSLIFQHVSYKRLRYNITTDSIQPLRITLAQSIKTLSDVVVTGDKRTKKIDPRALVETAVNRITTNYDPNPFLVHGYFSKRNTLYSLAKKTPFLLHLREATIHQRNPGLTTDMDNQKLHISHVRATKDYRSMYKPFSQRDTVTGFIPTAEYRDIIAQEINYLTPKQFMNLNPVQTKGDYRNSPQYRYKITYDWYGKLNKAFVVNHKFKLDQIAYDQYGQDSLYVIKILPSKKSIKMIGRSSYAIPLGKLFIHAQDLAIVRYEYGIFDNPKKMKGRTEAIFRSHGELNYRYKIIAEYTKVDQFYYLSYLKKEGLDLPNHFASANYAITSRTTGGISALLTNQTGALSLVVSQEFSATGFNTGTSVRSTWNSLRTSKDFYDLTINYQSDKSFWDTYNYPPESEEQRQLRLALEKRIQDLSQQNKSGPNE